MELTLNEQIILGYVLADLVPEEVTDDLAGLAKMPSKWLVASDGTVVLRGPELEAFRAKVRAILKAAQDADAPQEG